MPLKNLLITLLATFTLTSIANTKDAPIEIKGFTLGMSEKKACGDTEITEHQSTLNDLAPGLKMPSSSCEVPMGTIAGIMVTEDAYLLFWEKKLIRLKIKLTDVDHDEAEGLSNAFASHLGKQRIKKNPPFKTETWTKKNQEFSIEWHFFWPPSELPNATLTLTDSAAYKKFVSTMNAANTEIKKRDQNNRRNDIK